MARSVHPEEIFENPFGLVNMLGNVAEFCADWYAADAFSQYPDGILSNPTGPASGEEHVIRGGSYKDEADQVRCAFRDFTKSGPWLKTDPQIPKSVWWYSDCFHVGFRVVCEYNEPSVNE
jgi:formylglycine-generating enzyme required for sulfatase activity